MRSKKLSVQLLTVIAISFMISVIIVGSILHYVMGYFFENPNDVTLSNLLWIFAVILTFIISLLVMIRKKVKYLQHITESVQAIANGKLGNTIEIKGNDELSQLAANINDMSKELENKFKHERQIESAKNELITNISHDLRTPLTSIIGYVDLLKKKEYRDDEQLNDYLETIYSKSQNFKKLINELFEYTKLTSPDLNNSLHHIQFKDAVRIYVAVDKRT